MIGYLKGEVLEKQLPEILLYVNGIGYEITMPMSSFYELPKEGQITALYTHFIVREDAQLLYGFITKQERALFRELIKVSGFGPKLALAILSGMSATQLVYAVEQNEINTLIKIPGVGKKTAERLVVEMKDRFKRLTHSPLTTSTFITSNENISELLPAASAENEAIAGLITLGYKPQEASKMIRHVLQDGDDCEILIKKALKAAL